MGQRSKHLAYMPARRAALVSSLAGRGDRFGFSARAGRPRACVMRIEEGGKGSPSRTNIPQTATAHGQRWRRATSLRDGKSDSSLSSSDRARPFPFLSLAEDDAWTVQ